MKLIDQILKVKDIDLKIQVREKKIMKGWENSKRVYCKNVIVDQKRIKNIYDFKKF